MKTHTPGPWLVNYAQDRFDSKRSRIEIVDGSYDSLNHEQGPLVLARLNVMPFNDEDEPLANAHLIAAAPDLLAALELIYSNAGESPEWIRSRIGPVIEKAKGQF